MTKKFIPQTASNNTIKLFDASTGQLHRIIHVDGEIASQPICTDDELTVTVKRGQISTMQTYSMPNGTLKKTQSLQ